MSMAGRFSGKIVLITGAASGFGRLAAKRFAEEGAHLVLGDIDAEGLKRTATEAKRRGTKILTRRCDVSRLDHVEALVALGVEKLGRLDVALNNAGIVHPQMKVAETDPAVMRRMFEVNVMGVFHGMKAEIPVMEAQGGGVILNTASAAGLLGAPLLGAYAAAKHAVVGLTRTAAAETARKGLRINAICPAFAETPMLTGSIDQMRGGKEEAVNRLVMGVPMRRPGTADEIVEAMLFLCAPENSFMTGVALPVDGGLTSV